MQPLEHRLGEAHRGHAAVELLQRREQAQAGEGVEPEDRQDRGERAVAGDEQVEDEEQDAAERHRLQDVARHLADDLGRGVGHGEPLRRLVELAQIGLLEAEQLDLLDAVDRLAGDAELLPVGALLLLAEAGEALADPEIDQRVGADRPPPPRPAPPAASPPPGARSGRPRPPPGAACSSPAACAWLTTLVTSESTLAPRVELCRFRNQV